MIDGDPEAVYRALATIDIAAIPRSYLPVRALFAARTGAEHLVSALRRRPAPAHAEPDGPMRLAELPTHGEWVKLAEDPPHELVFGAVGRFWGGQTAWETIEADDFAAFDRPGFAKLACALSLRSYGDARTLVSYEARTLALERRRAGELPALLAARPARRRDRHERFPARGGR